MQLNPYLTFDGRCEAAFRYYEKVLGGKIVAMMPHEGTPAAEQVPAEWRKKIIHARLLVGDKLLMGSDAPPDRYEQPKGFSVTIGVDTAADSLVVNGGISESIVGRSLTKAGFGTLPVCMAKTQYSFSTDPSLRGRPSALRTWARSWEAARRGAVQRATGSSPSSCSSSRRASAAEATGSSPSSCP